MIVDESLNQYGTFSVYLLRLYQMYKLNDLCQGIFAPLKFVDRCEKNFHVCVSSRSQDQSENDGDPQKVDKEKHIESSVPQESPQKYQVIRPCKYSMQHAHQAIEARIIEGSIQPITEEAQARQDYEHDDFKAFEGGILQKQKHYNQQKFHYGCVEIHVRMHSKSNECHYYLLREQHLALFSAFKVEKNHHHSQPDEYQRDYNGKYAVKHVSALEARHFLKHRIYQQCLALNHSCTFLIAQRSGPRCILYHRSNSCYLFASQYAEEKLQYGLKQYHYHEYADVLKQGQGPLE